MTLRRVIFWIHLVVGVSAGLTILLLSSTGVLLSYEKGILGWSGHRFVEQAAPASGATSARFPHDESAVDLKRKATGSGGKRE